MRLLGIYIYIYIYIYNVYLVSDGGLDYTLREHPAEEALKRVENTVRVVRSDWLFTTLTEYRELLNIIKYTIKYSIKYIIIIIIIII